MSDSRVAQQQHGNLPGHEEIPHVEPLVTEQRHAVKGPQPPAQCVSRVDGEPVYLSILVQDVDHVGYGEVRTRRNWQAGFFVCPTIGGELGIHRCDEVA